MQLLCDDGRRAVLGALHFPSTEVLNLSLFFFLGLITWNIRLVLILVKDLLEAARNDMAFVESVFPFKEKKPHFTVLHWNLFTSSL